MADYEKSHWAVFNALGKFVGVCFTLVGVVVLIYGVAQRDWLFAVPGLVVTALGVLLTLARPYRPDNQRVSYERDAA